MHRAASFKAEMSLQRGNHPEVLLTFLPMVLKRQHPLWLHRGKNCSLPVGLWCVLWMEGELKIRTSAVGHTPTVSQSRAVFCRQNTLQSLSEAWMFLGHAGSGQSEQQRLQGWNVQCRPHLVNSVGSQVLGCLYAVLIAGNYSSRVDILVPEHNSAMQCSLNWTESKPERKLLTSQSICKHAVLTLAVWKLCSNYFLQRNLNVRL